MAPRRPKNPGRIAERRVTISFLLVSIVFSLLAGRALLIQGIDADSNAETAAALLRHKEVLKADRGVIVDRNGTVLAETQPAFQVIADPYSISTNGYDPSTMTDAQKQRAEQAPQAISEILARYLGGDAATYREKIGAGFDEDGNRRQYVLLARKVEAAVYQQMAGELSEQGWFGVYSSPDPIRYYPNGTLASNVLGFVNGENEGAAGIEYSQNAWLTGTDGSQIYQSSAYGQIPLGESALEEPVDGAAYQLTVDAEMQYMAETELANAVQKAGAKTGTAVIMAVDTGEVLALANYPSFDSNDPSLSDNQDLGNRAVTDAYEPGSVQKVLTMAALIDAGLCSADTKVEVPGRVASGSGYISDAWDHGTLYLTARGVLAQSSNVGTVLLTRQMDKGTLSNYLHSFGLGTDTGIELPGEVEGSMGSVPDASMPDYALDQISFGQGLSVTALQEAAAIAAVTNGGVYHAPTIVASATTSSGEAIEFSRSEPRRVISEEASAQVVNMMEASIASPEMTTLDANQIPGYRMAGKSGTAQRIGQFGNYDGGYTGSFVAVAPAEDPKILVYVVIDQPTNGYYGSQVAFPAARELMMQALPRYGVAPSSDIPDYTDPLTYQP